MKKSTPVRLTLKIALVLHQPKWFSDTEYHFLM